MLFACNEAASSYPGTVANVAKLRSAGHGKNVSVELNDIGRQFNQDIAPALIDLVEIAAFVYVADQMNRRGADDVESMGANWRRRMRFEIPVRVPSLWNSAAVGDALLELLSFLSEDEYEFTFSQYKHPPALESYLSFGKPIQQAPPDSVVLFSGGLDSLGGVIEEVVRGKRASLLVTHASAATMRERHHTLTSMIASATSGPRPHFITVRAKKKHRAEKEYTQRARSFMYASFAVAVARMADLNAIRFYENGVVSLNLPMSPQVVGSRATRTTHPRVLASMRRLFSLVTGTEFGVENPFLWKTKADVVADIVKAGHGSMIDYSISCTHTRKYRKDKPHCGVCSQCIDRRFAVLAADAAQFEPEDRYRHKLLTDPREEGESRIMLASYLETAQQVAAMDVTAFYSRYGEAVRALAHIDLPVDEAAKRIFELYRRHGQQIVSAIEAAGRAQMGQIIRRTLPESCTLRLVHDPNPNTAAATAPAAAGTPEPQPRSHQLVQQGQGWLLRFDSIDKHFELSVGMVYVHALLSNPNKRFTVAELYALARPQMKDIPSARSEAAFDQKAARAYWQRLNELDADIDAAAKALDTTAKSLAENEKARLLAELKAARFGNRMKVESADQKRLRDRVRNALDRTVGIIKKYHPTAGAHIDDAILRGSVMTYAPADIPPWDF
ncbi:MAG: 7-cyano-7-deazaguanine synthase [Phycisphaeraceae bacterium]|nr:7-cyano-7-deazaguanine synthase [Phycisphaeraceae bacterium]